MKIPEKIKILGFTYDIILKKTGDETLIVDGCACKGSVHYRDRKIYLLNPEGVSQESLLQILCHEIVHIIETHFDEKYEHTDLTEWQINMLATGLASIVLNNFNDIKKLAGINPSGA